MICEVFTFQEPGNTIVKMKSWHKHCTKKSQVQEARWAPQNQIWGALPGKWCENDALDADWLNFQGVKFSIARIQENIELQCASNLNNHGLTRSMLNWTSNMCKVVRMMEHSAPQSATSRKRPKKQIDITGEWTKSSCHDGSHDGVPWTPAVSWGHSVLWAHQLQVLDDMDDMASLWNCFITYDNLDVSEPWWDSLRQSFWNK